MFSIKRAGSSVAFGIGTECLPWFPRFMPGYRLPTGVYHLPGTLQLPNTIAAFTWRETIFCAGSRVTMK